MTKPISGVGGAPNIGSVMVNARTTPAAEPPAGKATIDIVNGRPGSRINGEARKPLAFNGEAQPLARWLVADAAALASLSVVADDVGYVARQASPLAFYRLLSAGPAVWELVGTSPTTDASQLTSGTLPAARLPAPTGLALGGVMRNTGAAGEFVTGIASDGSLQRGTPTGGASRTRGTYASRPGSPAAGDVYDVSDLPGTQLQCWSVGTWTVYFWGAPVVGCLLSDFPTDRNVNGTVSLTQLGPYVQIAMTSAATLGQLRGRTKARPSYPWAVEWAVVGNPNLGLIFGDPATGWACWTRGELQSNIGNIRLNTHNTSFQAVGTAYGSNVSDLGGVVFFRAHWTNATTVTTEFSFDRVSWSLLTTAVGATPEHIGLGGYGTAPLSQAATVLHYREYTP